MEVQLGLRDKNTEGEKWEIGTEQKFGKGSWHLGTRIAENVARGEKKTPENSLEKVKGKRSQWNKISVKLSLGKTGNGKVGKKVEQEIEKRFFSQGLKSG